MPRLSLAQLTIDPVSINGLIAAALAAILRGPPSQELRRAPQDDGGVCSGGE